MCASTPGFPTAKQCNSKDVESVACNPFLDKCMTVTGTITIATGESTNFQVKNCSNAILCNPDSPLAMCKLLNLTGLMTKCDIDCCEGDNCNAAVRISGLAACLLTVLLALLLN